MSQEPPHPSPPRTQTAGAPQAGAPVAGPRAKAGEGGLYPWAWEKCTKGQHEATNTKPNFRKQTGMGAVFP